MARFLSYENRAVLILSLTGGVAGIDMLAINFLNPFVAADLHLDNTQLGAIGLVQLVAWSVGAIVTALISDRWGRRKPFLVVTLLLFALFSGATALATSFMTLVLARALIGLAEGPVIPMQNALMLAASSPHRRGLNLGIVQNFGSQLLGALAGPLILVWIATHMGGWRNAFLIAGIPALLMTMLVYAGIRETPNDVGAQPPTADPVVHMLRDIAAVRNIRLCFCIGIGAVAWFGTMMTFIPMWAVRTLAFTPAAMSLVMGSIGAAGATAAILVPALSDRIGRRPALILFALFGTLLPLGLIFGPRDLPTVCALVFTGSLFMGIFPLFIGIIPMESVPVHQAASALAVVMGCAQILGGIIGPLLGGKLADMMSLSAPFLMACGLAIGVAIIALFLEETAPAKLR